MLNNLLLSAKTKFVKIFMSIVRNDTLILVDTTGA